jgi:hypothetical protein
MTAHYAVCSTSHFYSHLMNCLKQRGFKFLFLVVALSSVRSIVFWWFSHFFSRGRTLSPSSNLILLSSVFPLSLWEPKDLNVYKLQLFPYSFYVYEILSRTFTSLLFSSETGGRVVGWGIMLQAGRSQVRFPIKSLDFFNWPNPSSRTMALGSTQPLTEMRAAGRRVRLITSPSSVSRLSRRLTTVWASTACYRDRFAQDTGYRDGGIP